MVVEIQEAGLLEAAYLQVAFPMEEEIQEEA
jgi:hypothetical protein